MTAGPAGKLGHLAGTPGCRVPGAAPRRGRLSTGVAPAAREFPTWSGGEFESSWVRGLESRSLITVKRGGAFGHRQVDPPPPALRLWRVRGKGEAGGCTAATTGLRVAEGRGTRFRCVRHWC